MVWPHRTNHSQWLDSSKKIMSVQMHTMLGTLLTLCVIVSLSGHFFHKFMCLKRGEKTQKWNRYVSLFEILLLIKMNPLQTHRNDSIKITVTCLFSYPIYNATKPWKHRLEGSTLTISTWGPNSIARACKTNYQGADKSLPRPISRCTCILFNGENISFDASLVIYINSINIPPIMIINRIYENQNLLSL